MKDYFRPGSGLSLEPARWGLGSGVRGARGPRLATCSARSRRDARGRVGGLTRGDSCRWDSRALPSAQAMVAKQRIRMANEKHSKNITQRGNVAKTLLSFRSFRA
ncbi:stress-associated endoplasmic reticulum protein 2 isoform X4 [Leopardus geoffroyi]|uniref:stress-associated endoplasmic reticulum protein 2 isoform X4 n=1 Tax=Leopardus geoffroyi TaxID=46844 RepID=UPI001E265E07|nr:stress-associated endoplasmic reticulum protein 2 isoform X4 [Leopardus geoffroyi]